MMATVQAAHSRSKASARLALAPVSVAQRTRRARLSAARPWARRLMRFGYVVRGVVYVIPGALALMLALGLQGTAITQRGAIEWIGARPFGRPLLFVVALGLAGYALWGAVRAIRDPFNERRYVSGIPRRIGYGSSALGHLGLLIATIYLLTGHPANPVGARDWVATLLPAPFNQALVQLVGIGWILLGGVQQMRIALHHRFVNDLDIERLEPIEHLLALRLGEIGYATRAIVASLIGAVLIFGAFQVDAPGMIGIDRVLLVLEEEPLGRVLVGIVAIGLIVFGLFSILSARWIRMRSLPVSRNRVAAPGRPA